MISGKLTSKRQKNNLLSHKKSIASSVQDATERMFAKLLTAKDAATVVGGAGGSSSLDAFLRAETNWSKVKAFQAFETDQYTSPSFVTNDGAAGNPHCWQKLRDISVSKSKLTIRLLIFALRSGYGSVVIL